MTYSLYQLAFIFLIYAVMGWMTEEIFALVKHGKIVNRGFLKGPVCPIYGFGMVIIILCLSPVSKHLPALFVGSAILTTLLELVTGYVLEKFFHTKWWDYSEMHFNFRGYICLTFSILWGLAGVFIIDIVHPPVMRLINSIPQNIGYIILSASAAILAVDLVTTLISMIDLKKSMAKFDELAKRSEEIRLKLEQLAAEHDERRDERKAEFTLQLEQTKEKLGLLSSELRSKHKRFFNAFPHFERSQRFEKFKDALEAYRAKNNK